MATGGNGWLAQTPEETLEPEIPICDPHHHFWVSRPEPADYQQYLLPELAADVGSGHNVRSTVFIEVRCEYRRDLPAIAGWVARMWVSMECSMDLSRWAHWNRPTPATKQLSMQVEMPNWFLVSGKPMESAALCGSEILDTVAPLL